MADIIQKLKNLFVDTNKLSKLEYIQGQRRKIVDVPQNTYTLASKSIAYKCLNIRAESFAETNLIYSKQTSQRDNKELDINHWLVKLMNNPTDWTTSYEFYKLIQLYLDITGNVYIWTPILKGSRIPTNMYILEPAYVSIVRDGKKQIVGYRYDNNIIQVNIPIEQCIHLKQSFPLSADSDYREGYSIIESLKDLLGADVVINSFTYDYMNELQKPDIILRSDSNRDLSKEEVSTWKTQWNAKHSELHEITGYLSNDLHLDTLDVGGVPAGNVSFTEVNKMLIEKLCILFGIPRVKLTGESTSLASAKLADYTFLNQTMRPIIKNITQTLESFFSRYYEDNITITFQESDYTDPEQERRNIQTNIKNGIITINEVRSQQGLEPIEVGGDTHFINGTPLDIALNPPAQFNSGTFDLKDDNKIEKILPIKDDEREYNYAPDDFDYWKKTVADLDSDDEKIVKSLKPVFKEIEDKILDYIYSPKKSNKKELTTKDYKKIIEKDNIDLDEIEEDDLFTEEELQSLIETYSASIIAGIIKDRISNSLVKIGKDPAKINVEETFRSTINQMKSETVSRITTSSDTIKKDIYNILKNNDKADVDSIAKLISDELDGYKGKDAWKAKRIARTSTTYVNGKANTQTWKIYDVKYKWITEQDNRVRKSHEKMNGQIVKKGSFKAPDGLTPSFPGGFGKASEDINCRCVLRPIN